MKIAFFDIESAPSRGYFFDPWKEGNILWVDRPWFMLSFAWKEPGKKTIHCRSLPDYRGYRNNKVSDEKLTKDLWKLFDDFDILVGHNIKGFDCRKANSRFIQWGLKPPSPYVILDSLVEVKRVSYEDSNRLGSLSTKWGYGDKLPTNGTDTWKGCIDGNPADWRVMTKYNKIDVLRAEQVWGVIAPWKKTYGPASSQCCPNPTCGSLDVHRRGRVRQTAKFQFNCRSCGHWYTAKDT